MHCSIGRLAAVSSIFTGLAISAPSFVFTNSSAASVAPPESAIPAALGLTFPGGDVPASNNFISVVRKLSDWNTPLTEGDCSPYPKLLTESVEPDEPSNFMDHEAWTKLAEEADTPKGYEQKFTDEDTAVSTAQSTLLGGILLKEYDSSSCAAYCDMTQDCKSFNIFVERVPILRLNRTMCPDPPSQAAFVCTVWADKIEKKSENGVLYWGDFKIVAAGSNVYNKRGVDASKRSISSAAESSTELAVFKRECDGAPAFHNGDFEADDPRYTEIPTGWNVSDVHGNVTFGFTKPGHPGTYAFLATFPALNVTDEEETTRSFILSQQLNTCQGQQYAIGMSYRFDAEDYNITMGVLSREVPDKDFNMTTLATTFGEGDNVWHHWSASFVAREPNYLLALSIIVPGPHSNLASLDDITVEPVGQ